MCCVCSPSGWQEWGFQCFVFQHEMWAGGSQRDERILPGNGQNTRGQHKMSPQNGQTGKIFFLQLKLFSWETNPY